MKEIGGYFELDRLTSDKGEYYKYVAWRYVFQI